MKSAMQSSLDKLYSGLEDLTLDLSPFQHQQLIEYAERIIKWNKVYNLTALSKPEDVITHHLLDCLAVVPHFRNIAAAFEAPRLLDVGAGAGLPGIVLAICNPEWQITMVDTVQKKAAFIQQTCAGLKLLNASGEHTRVEKFRSELPFDLITSRAFASIRLFIDVSKHLIAAHGVFLPMKGRLNVDNDVPGGWQTHSILRIEVPFLPEERHLFVIQR